MTETATAEPTDDQGVVDEPVPSAEVELHRPPTILAPPPELSDFPGFEEMQGMAAMAVTLAGAQAVPAALRDRPNDVFLILLTARELGIAPTAALRTCHVINGVVTLAPKLRAAKVRQHGIGRIWPDEANDSTRATWHATRTDEDHGRTYSFTFTIEDAQRVEMTVDRKQASLADKDNWRAYPQRMLSWRALGYLLDDVFPEVGTGLYSAEEMGAMTDGDGEVIDVREADPLPGTKTPKGHKVPPPPPEPLLAEADPAAMAELRRRIDAIGVAGDARDALVALWTERDEAGVPRLPHRDQLTARQLPKVNAVVASIETRIKRGDFGDDAKTAWTAAVQPPAEAAPAAPAEPEPTAAGDNPPEPEPTVSEPTAADAAEAYERELAGTAEVRSERAEQVAAETEVVPTVEILRRVTEQVDAMKPTDVVAALEARRMSTDGSPRSKRDRLTSVLFLEAGGEAEPDPADETREQPTLDEA